MRGGYVPIGTVRAHVAELRGAGLTLQQIAERAGLPPATFNSAYYYAKRWVQQWTADAILGIPVPLLDVPQVRARRQLQALAWMGWSARALSERSSVSRWAFSRLRRGESSGSPRCRAEVARLYAELWDVPSTEPDAPVLRGHARARGWVSPLAWDDELMGNPSVQPMGVAA